MKKMNSHSKRNFKGKFNGEIEQQNCSEYMHDAIFLMQIHRWLNFNLGATYGVTIVPIVSLILNTY